MLAVTFLFLNWIVRKQTDLSRMDYYGKGLDMKVVESHNDLKINLGGDSKNKVSKPESHNDHYMLCTISIGSK